MSCLCVGGMFHFCCSPAKSRPRFWWSGRAAGSSARPSVGPVEGSAAAVRRAGRRVEPRHAPREHLDERGARRMNRRAAEALSNGNTRDGAAGTRSAFSSPRRTRAMPSCSRLRPRAACPSCASSCPARAPSDLPALLGRSCCFARQQIRAARPVADGHGCGAAGLEEDDQCGGGRWG